jgi:acyl-CoA reductase-like NAD-dependent aldehyde dehydrogenase
LEVPLIGEKGACAATHAVALARAAQSAWAETPMKSRLKILRRFRGLAAGQAAILAGLSSVARSRPLSEALTAEVVPLLEAVRFLERQAGRILATRVVGRQGRPAWLLGVEAEVRREPFGVVLVIGPSNYPLFLPAVHALQAVVAGNAVVIKPGAGGYEVMRLVADLLHHSGLDHRLVQLLPEASVGAGAAIRAVVDKVVLTGSAETGIRVLEQLAGRLTPAVMELSGCDASVVRADADVDLAVRALRFGTLLNQGATCIAPRRVFVHRAIATELEGRLARAFAEDGGGAVEFELKPEWVGIVREALRGGAHLVSGALSDSGHCRPPLVLAGAHPAMRLLQNDVFAPVLSLVTVADDHEAIELARQCPYALGATIFSRNLRQARALAGRISAGVVVINDMIVPTADPRLPFAGRRRSGFGVTRGAEGLIEMTTPKAIAVRRSRWLPHLEPVQPGDAKFFEDYVVAVNAAGWLDRLKAGGRMLRSMIGRGRPPGADAAANRIPMDSGEEVP